MYTIHSVTSTTHHSITLHQTLSHTNTDWESNGVGGGGGGRCTRRNLLSLQWLGKCHATACWITQMTCSLSCNVCILQFYTWVRRPRRKIIKSAASSKCQLHAPVRTCHFCRFWNELCASDWQELRAVATTAAWLDLISIIYIIWISRSTECVCAARDNQYHVTFSLSRLSPACNYGIIGYRPNKLWHVCRGKVCIVNCHKAYSVRIVTIILYV